MQSRGKNTAQEVGLVASYVEALSPGPQHETAFGDGAFKVVTEVK